MGSFRAPGRVRDEVTPLYGIGFISDAYLARSFENKEHFFVHMMVMQRERALARRNHRYVISQLLGVDFPPNLSEHCTVESRLYRSLHGNRKWSKLKLRNVDDRCRHARSPLLRHIRTSSLWGAVRVSAKK